MVIKPKLWVDSEALAAIAAEPLVPAEATSYRFDLFTESDDLIDLGIYPIDEYAWDEAAKLRLYAGGHEGFVLGEFERFRDVNDGDRWGRWSYNSGDSMLSDAFKDDTYRDLDDIVSALAKEVGPMRPAECRCGIEGDCD